MDEQAFLQHQNDVMRSDISKMMEEIARLSSAFDSSQVALLMCVSAMEATHSEEAKYADMSDAELSEMWNTALTQGRAQQSSELRTKGNTHDN